MRGLDNIQSLIFSDKENVLSREIGLDPYERKPLLYYAFDSSIFSDDLYGSVADKLDQAGDRFSWIDQHPFLFSLCLVRRFFEQSNGVRYNLFANGLKIDKKLKGSLGGVFQDFDSDRDRRYNFHKVLAESLFFFGAQTSQYYGVLSHVRQEFGRAESVEDAYRTILNDETTLPFAYDYLLQDEDDLFRELLCGKHTENMRLQEVVTRNLSRLLRDTSANTGWAINWSAKKLDVLVERLVLADGSISNLTVKCDGRPHPYSLDKCRYETVENKRRFPTIRISELFDDLPLRSGCEVSLGPAYKKTVNGLFRSEAPLIFRKAGDIARLWTPNDDNPIKEEDVIRASELVLLKRDGAVHDVRLGDELLSLDRKSISLGGCRYSSVLIAVNQRHGERAKPLIVDGIQICKAGVRPRFEVVDQAIRIHSSGGDLFCANENVELQLNSQENIDEEKLKVTGLDYSVSGSSVFLTVIPEGVFVPVVYDKIKTRIVRLPAEYERVESAPMKAIDGFWKPNKPKWGTPGKTTGTLFCGDQEHDAWVPWELVRFAWKKIGVGHEWEHGEVQTFSSFGELAKCCVELWSPVRGKLKLGDVELSQFEEGLNSVRFDSPEIRQALRSCLQDVETIGAVKNLCCYLDDGICLVVAKVSLEPITPILVQTQTAAFSVYVPCDADVENWNVCILEESRIGQPIQWLKLVRGRKDFGLELNGACSWVLLCTGNDWKTKWIEFCIQSAGRIPTEMLSFVPPQRAPLEDRLSNIENIKEQLGLIRDFLGQFDMRIFRETLVDAKDSGIPISRISTNLAQKMFRENLSLETIEQKVEQLLRAGFNIFSVRSRCMDWIEGMCTWTQGKTGTASQLWQKCPWFPSMALFRNRFPLLEHNSDAWRKFYSGRSNCNQLNLKQGLKEYFPSGTLGIFLNEGDRSFKIWGVEKSDRQIRVQIEENGAMRPVYFSTWQKTIQFAQEEQKFSVYDIDTKGIYPWMSETLCGRDFYNARKNAKMYISKKMYKCACFEACMITDQLVFSEEKLMYLYEKLIGDLNLSISRDKILNSVLERCYEEYQVDKRYSNRVSVLILAAFSRRHYYFSDDNHQMFMEGMLRAYRTCRHLLMNDLMAVEFFRVWFSRK